MTGPGVLRRQGRGTGPGPHSDEWVICLVSEAICAHSRSLCGTTSGIDAGPSLRPNSLLEGDQLGPAQSRVILPGLAPHNSRCELVVQSALAGRLQKKRHPAVEGCLSDRIESNLPVDYALEKVSGAARRSTI